MIALFWEDLGNAAVKEEIIVLNALFQPFQRQFLFISRRGVQKQFVTGLITLVCIENFALPAHPGCHGGSK